MKNISLITKIKKVGDHKFSLSPKELKVMIQNIKLAEASMGLNKRLISKKEKIYNFCKEKGFILKKTCLKVKKFYLQTL